MTFPEFCVIFITKVKSLFSRVYKFLVLTLFDKIRTCFEIKA